MTPARARRAGAALVVYSIALGVALLAPTPGTQSEMASWLVDLGLGSQARAEFVCNVLIVVPAAALGRMVWPRTTWRHWTAYAFLAAVAVEVVQGLLLPHRTASYVDIVANALGGLIGALAVGAMVRLRQSRP